MQALLQELRGLDSPPPADEEAAGRVPFARNKSAEDAGAVSDYAAWYEDYVKAQSTSSATEKVPRESIKQVATSPAAQPGPASDEARDPRKLTYAQALPIISKLAADNAFLEALQEVRCR